MKSENRMFRCDQSEIRIHIASDNLIATICLCDFSDTAHQPTLPASCKGHVLPDLKGDMGAVSRSEGGQRFRMPLTFGPSPSPRQRPDGQPWTDPMARIRAATVSFLTDHARLADLLPPGLSLDGEPVVTVEHMAISELQWLAGRGYNTLGVRIPVTYCGPNGHAKGPFLALLWENKADPIITGREELGYAKLFCDLPPGRVLQGRECFEASWEGHRFMEMTVLQLAPATPAPATRDGTLHYRYLPSLSTPGAAEVEGLVITPPSPKVELLDHAVGEGAVRFIPSTWEQLPTLAHIVNILANLPLLEARGATLTNLRVDTSLHNHKTLE